MNPLIDLQTKLRSGEISKPGFISGMYEEHRRLFNYPEFLSQTNVTQIMISPDGVVAEFRDPPIKMICAPGDIRTAPIEAVNFGAYERTEIAIVRRLVEALNLPSPRFLDIGANAGFYSLALCKYFPHIKGIAFEPVPSTFALLKANLKLNATDQVKCENIGLSDCSEQITFYTYPSQSGAASMTNNLGSAEAVRVTCNVERLDTYLHGDNDPIHFLKVDVEGAELKAFEGAKDTIQKHTPAIFTEMLRKWCSQYNYHPNDIISFFQKLGYECYTPEVGRISRCHEVTEATVATNYLFMHADAHKRLITELKG